VSSHYDLLPCRSNPIHPAKISLYGDVAEGTVLHSIPSNLKEFLWNKSVF
jgi:hypothetical protein